MKKQFLILFAFISALALGQAPQRFNKVIVTGDIASPKFIKTGSNADSVLLGNGSARSVNSLKTDTVSLSNRINAKATGSGTANGTNTGDETITSIKTKLGAATAVSDGYLKYQDWSIFNSKEPAIPKNTGFNKNFGTTTGTVLEGRTFGTAANSAVGDFIQNQNSSAQPGSAWLNGTFTSEGGFRTKGRVANPNNGAILFNDGTGENLILAETASSVYSFGSGAFGTLSTPTLSLNTNTRTATFSSTVNSTGFLLNGNNLTSSLTTNYIPKWNGSNFVNSFVIETGSTTYLNNNGATRTLLLLNDTYSAGIRSNDGELQLLFNSDHIGVKTNSIGTTVVSTTPSTSPTNGALVVSGGIGACHVRANNFYGNGSNLTGVQLPITLTTNGTSGAATFSGNVLNVPNYTSSGSFIQNQSASAQSGSLWVSGNIISNDKIEGITISTERVDINTSGAQINFYGTSGSGVLSQPFRGLNYKKVMIYLANFVGNKNINYLTAFTYPPAIVITDGLSSSLITSKSTTSVTITSASSATGILILEGY